MKQKRLSLIVLSVLSAIAIVSCAAFNANSQVKAPAYPKFAQPIQCSLGDDCYILRYVDRDPGPGEIDFKCGRLTGDGHKGTDFGIPDEWSMRQGIPVLASAPGEVLRVRDGVPDKRITSPEELAAVQGINCGNAIVIDHGEGWETQYCHLRQGSVAVKPGDKVTTGTVLGMVGSSGESSFPHVHLTLRYQGNNVDPFVGPDVGPGCEASGQSLWSTDINYTSAGLIRAGFASEIPSLDRIWSGDFRDSRLSVNSDLLVFWIHLFGVLQGDEETFRLVDPQGNVVAEGAKTYDRPTRIAAPYAGKKNSRDRPLITGTWRGEYTLKRGNTILVKTTQTVVLE
ncbi:M23 family metallopeptidase [Roseofilum casamattae]|uniref:M23 family metallopeptidase n=1 Tax=Roseofilum casamattae BLCC-M143 TaxID=3022442 RepID=A0ABT7BXL9_9CYAN|nr:M23 family metallopeptidase [Roseofilum casamattae]MDJ1183038.1 M23 family metallopeptidase [Roseofilum casamattae BLCC-M143]